MNCSVYTFTKSGEVLSQYPNDYTSEIFDKFVELSLDSEQIIIHRNNNLVYYGYTRRIDVGQSNEVVGLCVVFNCIVYYDLDSVAKILSSTLDDLLKSKSCLINLSNHGASSSALNNEVNTNLRCEFEKIDSSIIPPLDPSCRRDLGIRYTINNYQEHIHEIFNYDYVTIQCVTRAIGTGPTNPIKLESGETKESGINIDPEDGSLKYLAPFCVILIICPIILLVVLALNFDASLMQSTLLGYSVVNIIASVCSVICIKKKHKATLQVLSDTFIFGAFLSLLCDCSNKTVVSSFGILLFLVYTIAYISLSFDEIIGDLPESLARGKQSIIFVSLSLLLFLFSIGIYKTHDVKIEPSGVDIMGENNSPTPTLPQSVLSPVDTSHLPLSTGDNIKIETLPPVSTTPAKRTEKPSSSKKRKNVTINLSYGEYVGDAKWFNGAWYPDGKGKLVYSKEYLVPNSHPHEKICAGEYVTGEFERGFLVRYLLYKSDGTFKKSKYIGTPPKGKFADR